MRKFLAPLFAAAAVALTSLPAVAGTPNLSDPNATYLIAGFGFEEFYFDGFIYDSNADLIPFAESRYSDTTAKGDPSIYFPDPYVSKGRLYFNGTNLSSAWEGEGGLINPGDVGAYSVFSTSTVNAEVPTTRRLTSTDILYRKHLRSEVDQNLIYGETRSLQDSQAFAVRIGNGRRISLKIDSTGYRITTVTFSGAKVNGAVTLTWSYSLDGTNLIPTGVSTTVGTDVPLTFSSDLSAVAAFAGATDVWLVPTLTGAESSVLILDNIQVIGVASGGTTPTSPATLTGTPPSTATVGAPYSFDFTVGGTPTPTLARTAGTFPPGLSMNGATLSGTPTAAGVYSGITVTATNVVASDAKTFSITVNGPATLAGSPAAGIVGAPFTHTFTVGGYPAPTSVTLQSGALPAGLTLSGLTLSGTPTASGVFTYTVRATNAQGSADLVVSQSINAVPTLTPPASLTAIRGTAYSGNFTLGGYPVPTTITLQSGALPAGLALSGAGISGTPTVAGAYSFTVAVTNAAGTTTRAVTLDVQSVPTVTLPSGGTLTFSTLSPATADIVADGLPAPVVTVSGLPAWLTVTSLSDSSTGRTTATLSGTPPIGAAPSYSLNVHATNAAGSPTDQTLTLNIVATTSAPTITTQPVGGNVALNGSYTFSVVATGVPTPTYQWRKGVSAISGATAPSYTISNAQAGDAAGYSVVVTNNTGTVTSASATLVVLVPVTITAQPASVAVGVGDPVNLSVTATGLAPLSYQWRKDGTALTGATSPSYTIASATLANSGNYDVVVTNPAGSVTSAVASVAVASPPTISAHPVGGTFAAGHNVRFTVVAQSVTPLSYQWRKDGAVLAGATDATLEFASAEAADSGTYDVVVTNNRGSVTSHSATLTIIAAPQFTVQPISSLIVAGHSVTFEVTATPAGVGYQWLRDGVAIDGATTAQLTVFDVGAAETRSAFTCRISNLAGAITSAPGYVVAYAPTSRVVPLTGGSFSVEVFAPAAYSAWSVASDVGWLTPVKGEDGFTYQVPSAPQGAPRSGRITVTVPGLGLAVHEVAQQEFVVLNADFSTGVGAPGSEWDPFGATSPAVLGNVGGRSGVLGLGAFGSANALSAAATAFAAAKSRQALSRQNDRRVQTDVFLAINSAGAGQAEAFLALIDPTAGAAANADGEPPSGLRLALWHAGPAAETRLRGHTWITARFKAADGKFRSLNLATALPQDELENRWVRLAADVGTDGKLSVWVDPEPFGDPVRVWTSATPVHTSLRGEQAFLLGLRGESSSNRPYQSSPIVSGGFAPRAAASRIVGLSTRAWAGTGEQVAIAGYATSGGDAPLLVRGLGPMLSRFGVTGTLAGPRLVGYDSRSPAWVVRVQDAWEMQRSLDTIDAILEAEGNLGLVPLEPGALDAAFFYRPAGGAADQALRTVHLKSADGKSSGQALLELYSTNRTSGGELVALSTRAQVPKDTAMIPGVVVDGNAARLFLVRAVGPGLSAQGITAPLQQPQLQVFRGSRSLLQNRGWGSSPAAALLPAAAVQTGAFALAAGSGDSAVLVRLPPGAITVPITAGDAGTGVALAEIYALPLDAELDTVTE